MLVIITVNSMGKASSFCITTLETTRVRTVSNNQSWNLKIQSKNYCFSYFSKKTCCGYSLESPRRGSSNEYPQYMYLLRNMKIIMWIPPLIRLWSCERKFWIGKKKEESFGLSNVKLMMLRTVALAIHRQPIKRHWSTQADYSLCWVCMS